MMIHVTYSDKFSYSTSQLATQYYHIYNVRLKCARPALIKCAHFRWGQDVKNVPLEQLNASLGSKNVFVIGTLFKSMPKQRSILKELEGDQTPVEDVSINLTSDEDSLILHETDENVQLVGEIDIHMHVTGIPVALLGCQLNGGAKFQVSDICYAGPILDVYTPDLQSRSPSYEPDSNILLISGLEFNSEMSKEYVEALKKLRTLVHKKIYESNGSKNKQILKVIIAGNSVASGLTKNSGAADSVKVFDRYLYELAQSGVEITLMPGKNDPSTFLIPQQPFHPKILNLSSSLKNVKPTTNPCSMTINNYHVIGTSGENVDAIRQHSKIEHSTTILKSTLEWGHIAPSAPDNLSCLPFKEHDPLLIDQVPDLYFAGNQPEFGTSTYSCDDKSAILLVSVPNFSKTHCCALVDILYNECEPVYL